MKKNNRAYTLIELLVVVLIIGILVAVALPQYQKAVVKSHFAEAMGNLRSLDNAQRICILEKGADDCTGTEDLDVSVGEISNNYFVSNTFVYVTDPYASVVAASYKKDNACICYNGETNQLVLAKQENNWCFDEWTNKTPRYDYGKLLGLTQDKNCVCC